MATSGTRDSSAIEGAKESVLIAKPAGWIATVRQFWKETALEMKKVSWPTRPEVINTTIIVVIAIFFFAAYLFVADIVFSYVISGIEWAAKQVLG